ncbi:MAG TPA: META domain-containing protein [Galbitalea sp.]|jgi:heat shock protein HslJ|nr:META domain-containing protein [Galbitalea sp.]
MRAGRTRSASAVAAAIGVATALALAGCAPTGRSIAGTWQLVKATDSKGALDLSGLHVTLTVKGAKSGGQGPCNYYGVGFDASTTGRRILTSGSATTMGCIPSSRLALDSRYFAVLAGPVTATIKHNDLVLVGAKGTLEYKRDDA